MTAHAGLGPFPRDSEWRRTLYYGMFSMHGLCRLLGVDASHTRVLAALEDDRALLDRSAALEHAMGIVRRTLVHMACLLDEYNKASHEGNAAWAGDCAAEARQACATYMAMVPLVCDLAAHYTGLHGGQPEHDRENETGA